jgi:hypothetical protein
LPESRKKQSIAIMSTVPKTVRRLKIDRDVFRTIAGFGGRIASARRPPAAIFGIYSQFSMLEVDTGSGNTTP